MLSGQVWRIADLGAKHSFLLAGLRWSGMPMHMVEADQARGTLVRLSMDDPAMNIHTMTLSAAYPVEYPPGPAGRWLIERLRADLPEVG